MCLIDLVRGKGRLSMAVQRMQRLQSGHLEDGMPHEMCGQSDVAPMGFDAFLPSEGAFAA